MSLTVGTRLGAYEIAALLGAGGMGVVYRARDTRLRRDVAIKILPDAVATDADRLMRFQREAQVLASLNHPHIAQIYGLEGHALVMELVEGRTIQEMIHRSPGAEAPGLHLSEALAIARQIVDALEAAHAAGIVHRDLKPANIKVRDDGTVKVLDFGLARALAPDDASATPDDPANSPTVTFPAMTARGEILGTAAYMSPEQARGRVVDKRADIWAFGVVLFEMLTGRRLFHGESVSDTLAAVLRQDVNWTLLPPATPTAVRQTLARCLERDPRKRLRDIGDAQLDELDDAAARAVTRVTPLWKRLLPWVAGAVGMLAVWLAARQGPVVPGPVLRTTIDLPAGLQLPARDRAVALSPDGRQVALVLEDSKSIVQLYLRSLDKLDLRALAGTEGATYPFWSPDGRALGFFAANQLRRIDLPDGPVRTVSAATAGRGASWGAGDQIVFAAAEEGRLDTVRLYQVSAAGNQTPQKIGPDGAPGQLFRLPHVLPNDAGLLYQHSDDRGARTGVYVLAPGQREPRRILDVSSEAQYVPPGWLAFVRDGLLIAQPFDLKTLSLSGTAAVVGDRVHWDTLRGTGHFTFSRVPDGPLVYQRDPAEPRRQLEWFDRDGRRMGTVGEPAQFSSVVPSPDGTRALVGIVDQLWMMDLASGVRSPFYSAPGQRGDRVVWSPDGRRVAFRDLTNGGRLAIRSADATPESQILIGKPGENWAPSGWSRDGSAVIASIYRGVKGNDLAIVSADGKGDPKMLLDGPAYEGEGALSPDGKWLGFVSTESGQPQVYVTAYPALGRKWPVTSGGGVGVQWTSNELIYQDLKAVTYALAFRPAATGLEFSSRRPILGGGPIRDPGNIASRVNRFLIATLVGVQDSHSLVVATNWPSDIKK